MDEAATVRLIASLKVSDMISLERFKLNWSRLGRVVSGMNVRIGKFTLSVIRFVNISEAALLELDTVRYATVLKLWKMTCSFKKFKSAVPRDMLMYALSALVTVDPAVKVYSSVADRNAHPV